MRPCSDDVSAKIHMLEKTLLTSLQAHSRSLPIHSETSSKQLAPILAPRSRLVEVIRRIQRFELVEDELIADIRALSGEAFDPGQARRVDLERLHELKRKATFPFMELPPEM